MCQGLRSLAGFGNRIKFRLRSSVFRSLSWPAANMPLECSARYILVGSIQTHDHEAETLRSIARGATLKSLQFRPADLQGSRM